MKKESGLSFSWDDENDVVNGGSLAEFLSDEDETETTQNDKEEKVPEKGEDEFFEGNEFKQKNESLRDFLDTDDMANPDTEKNEEDNDIDDNEDFDKQSNYSESESPFSDFLKYCKDNSIPEIDEEQIKNCKTVDDLSEIIQSVVEKRLDDETKAIRDSQIAGVDYSELNVAKNNIEYLKNKEEDILSAEGEDIDNIRKNLLMYYFNIKGYEQEIAEEEVQDIFDSGKEIEKLKRYLPEMVKFNENKIKSFNKNLEDRIENQKRILKDSEKKSSTRKLLLEIWK